MKYVLWVELLNFYCDNRETDPVIVSRESQVLDANSSAVLKGIRVGMDLHQVRNILPRCQIIAWKEGAYKNKQREWLDLCAQYSGVIEPIDSHIACIDLSSHPNPSEVCRRVISTLSRSVMLPLSYGAGPSKWIARVASFSHEILKSVDDPGTFISTLDTSCLLPVHPNHRERLIFLGYRHIGEIAIIPLKVLQAQFGESALSIKKAASGHMSDPVKALYPAYTIKECLWHENPIDDHGTLDQSLIRLSKKMSRRLVGQQSSELELITFWEELDSLRSFRRFTRPIHDYSSLLTSLRSLYSSQKTCDGRILGLSASLTTLSQVQLKQHAFFTAKERLPIENTIKTVNQVFGEGAIVLGSERVVPRRERVLKELRYGTGWR